MKLAPLVLAGSLAANAALVVIYLNRTAAANASDPGEARSETVSRSANSKPETQNSKPTSASAPSAADSKAWASLDSADLRTLTARLRAAGFPPTVVNAVIRAQIAEKMRPRMQALVAGAQDKPFWATDRNFGNATDPKTLAAMRDLSRESNDLFKAAVGVDSLAAESAMSDYTRRRYGNIPASKIDSLQRIESDYNELRTQVTTDAKGLMLPEDREKLALLETEKRADLAKILSPQELEDFLVRSSTTTSRLRTALTNMNATEDEFRAIYQAQSAYDEKYAFNNVGMTYMNADAMKERQAAQAQMNDQLKLALGDQRFAEYTRASDREFQTISRLAQQSNLPATAAVQVYDLRNSLSKESNRIFADTALTVDQKRAALQTLAQTTRTQITSTLGDSASRSYLQTATWLTRVESGSSVTFTPGGGTSTRSLPVARPPGAAAGSNSTTNRTP